MARKRYAVLDRELLLRAARHGRLPGVRRSETCARYGLSIGMLRRAMKELALEAIPSQRDLVLHAITQGGSDHSGDLPNLAAVASYVDYVNKDGSTEADVRRILDAFVDEGVLALDGSSWRLLRDFP